MKPIAIGLVGYGKIARDQHEPAIAASPDFELAAVTDPAAVHAFVPSYPALPAMLEAEPAIEAVSLCMQPRFRAQAARDAILAGRHVLLEKPPSTSVAEAEELIALAQERGVSLYAAWHSQQSAALEAARSWLAGTAIRSVRVDWKEDVRVWHPGQDWIWQDGGFGVFDPGINALSILSALLPGPLLLTEADLEVPDNCATPIGARLSLQSGAGMPVRAEFDFHQTGPQTWDIRMETDLGELVLSHGGNRLFIGGEEIAVGNEAEYPALYARFAALIRVQEIEADLAPLRLVEQAMLVGRVRAVGRFEE